MRKGTLQWQIEGRSETVRPNSVFFTLPWQAHGSTRETEPGCELHFVVIALDTFYRRPAKAFGFAPGLGLSGRTAASIAQRLLRARRQTRPASPALARLLPPLVAEQASTGFAKNDYIAALARCVVLELARTLERPPTANHTLDDAQQRVTAFLAELPPRCAEAWTIDTMAAACTLKRTRFAEIVAQQTGDTPIMALNRLRVDRARTLLRSTDRSVTDIAFDCGFATSQYFARVFRDYAGISPRAYREQT